MSAHALTAVPRLAARVRLQVDRVTGKPVLLYPEGVLELNETAGEVLRLCDGQRTVAEIITALAAEFEATDDEFSDDVLTCLAELHGRNLVTA